MRPVRQATSAGRTSSTCGFQCCSCRERATSSRNLALLKAMIGKLGARATLKLFDDADHSFHVPARTGRKDSETRVEMADALAAWIASIAGE